MKGGPIVCNDEEMFRVQKGGTAVLRGLVMNATTSAHASAGVSTCVYMYLTSIVNFCLNNHLRNDSRATAGAGVAGRRNHVANSATALLAKSKGFER